MSKAKGKKKVYYSKGHFYAQFSRYGSQAECQNQQKQQKSSRISTDVLLAIKAVRLANIGTRQKNHEFRSYRLQDGITRLWFYEMSDGGADRSAATCVLPCLLGSSRMPTSDI